MQRVSDFRDGRLGWRLHWRATSLAVYSFPPGVEFAGGDEAGGAHGTPFGPLSDPRVNQTG